MTIIGTTVAFPYPSLPGEKPMSMHPLYGKNRREEFNTRGGGTVPSNDGTGVTSRDSNDCAGVTS